MVGGCAIQKISSEDAPDFCWLRFTGYPKDVIDIMSNDNEAIRIKNELGQVSEQYMNRADELMKIHDIPEPKRNVWVRDSPTGQLYLKLLTRQEHFQHYQTAGQKT